MKTLIEKEIRMLLPAFAGALVLAILPVWFPPYDSWNPRNYSVYFFAFGIAMLALSSFGRELGLKTIPFMLAQPLHRSRIWWVKVAVLGLFVTLALDMWWLSGRLSSLFRPELPAVLPLAGVIAAVLTGGGLCMTLLLRQVAAAIWLTLLVPMVMVLAIQAAGGADWMILASLGLYAAGAFFQARRQFLGLQDTTWTGGVVSFGSRRAAVEQIGLRQPMPWTALVRKELKLQEFTLAGIAALFVVHLGVVALRKLGAYSFGKTTLSTLQMFSVVWVFVPLVAGSQSVAEERQLGTLDALLCLPVSRRAQFGIKLLFVLVLGGLLSPSLMSVAEGIGNAMGAGAHLGVMGIAFGGAGIVPVFFVFLGLSLFGFYASTLTRSVVQALAAGVVTVLVFWGILMMESQSVGAFGYHLWLLMAFPTLTATILWLAYGNFRWLFESARRWRRNILGLITLNVLICVSAAGIYHRAWEWAMPLEGTHGPARLPAGKPVLLGGYGGTGLAAVLPDGRLWVDHIAYDAGWLSAFRNQFVPGSNWVEALAGHRETVALRADGTLWVSEKRLQARIDDRHPPPTVPSPLVQFGADSDWQSMQCNFGGTIALLKRDGTLWNWGSDGVNHKHYDGLRSAAPQRMGPDSDWARIGRGIRWVYAWKRDGAAWALHEPEQNYERGNVRLPGLDHFQFRSLNAYPCIANLEMGVRDDGTLWYWDEWKHLWGPEKPGSAANQTALPQLQQIGKESNWAAVTSGFYQLVALKTDGTLWKWNLFGVRDRMSGALQEAPKRLGTHDDWVALGSWLNQSVALAADGTFWRWPITDAPWGRNDADSDAWIAPSRRPAKIENIFGAQE